MEPSVDRKTPRWSLRVFNGLFGGPPGPGFFPSDICSNTVRLGNRSLFCRTIAPVKWPPFSDGRFGVTKFRLLEGLDVREVGVVGTTL